MGNVGVVVCRPLFIWRAGLWLFFDQRFCLGCERELSTSYLKIIGPKKTGTNLWISLWLNSGKNALGGVMTGLWRLGRFH